MYRMSCKQESRECGKTRSQRRDREADSRDEHASHRMKHHIRGVIPRRTETRGQIIQSATETMEMRYFFFILTNWLCILVTYYGFAGFRIKIIRL